MSAAASPAIASAPSKTGRQSLTIRLVQPLHQIQQRPFQAHSSLPFGFTRPRQRAFHGGPIKGLGAGQGDGFGTIAASGVKISASRQPGFAQSLLGCGPVGFIQRLDHLDDRRAVAV